MEKIAFTSPESGESIELFVLEQTVVSGREYLLATEEDTEEAEAFILRKLPEASAEDTAGYEFVEDQEELQSIGKVFAELLTDTDLII